MPKRDDISYFGAGPAVLPTSTVERAAEAFINYDGTGLGLAEISHRSATANDIIARAKDSLKKLLSVPDTHEIIFAHGGGSGAFASIIYNMVGYWAERQRRRIEKNDPTLSKSAVREKVFTLAKTKLKLDYIITGSWSLKASQEAADLLSALAPDAVNIAADSRRNNPTQRFGTIPPESSWNLTQSSSEEEEDPAAAFLYYCDNETVDGVEFPQFPDKAFEEDRLVVADMSSNILTRAVDVSKYAVIFAGAQKNVGITDTTILIVRKTIIDVYSPKSFILPVPAIMHWPTLAKHGSLYNTIPIFSLYVAADVMQQLIVQHGALSTGSQARLSKLKADSLYGVLDANPDLFQLCADKDSRSRMNICFRIKGGDETLEKQFISKAEEWGLLGLKGHRSVGGIRISNYNAVTLESIEKLEAFILDYCQKLKAT